ncbi:MAG: DNA-processing protein DprA [Bacillota bacterium]|nr:DNA-processing protein DprA [Bacillota bacterium]
MATKDYRSFHILRLMETPGIGAARVRQVLNWANSHSLSLAELLEDTRCLNQVLSEHQARSLRENTVSVEKVWTKLETMGARIITTDDPDYPPLLKVRLGIKAPPFLVVLGNDRLLKKLGVGFCGARRASERGLAVARDCAEQLVRKGLNIVSGYAAGVDIATHGAALENGGTTTIVLAEGVFHFRVRRELKDVWDWQRVAVVSEFLPGLPWQVRQAMQRNATICGLSAAMVLIEAGSTGGSIEAGRAALRMGVPLYAPVYEGMPASATGNRELLRQGAQPLGRNPHTLRANVEGILKTIQDAKQEQVSSNPKEGGRQLRILD